jgi:hypothetical protein
LANATFIGRGYNTIATRSIADGTTTIIEPATGPNYKDNGSAKVYNSLFMDSPHGAMFIMDRQAVGFATASTSAGNSAINRFTVARTTGGFDGAGRGSDLITTGAGVANPNEKDGLFNNVWFFRNGLLDTGATGVSGKHASLGLLNDDVTANPNSYFTAGDSALFPDRGDRTERGANNGALHRANTSAMISVIKGSHGVKFDQNPGVAVPLNHHLSGIDIKPTASAARDLTDNQLPNYDTAGTTKTTRSLVTGAAFVGAVRDSSWFRGWNFASQSGCFANTAVAIVPTVSVEKTVGGNPKINFGAETGVKYSLEVSSDNKSFVPVTVLEGANLPYTDTSKQVGTTALYYRAIAL